MSNVNEDWIKGSDNLITLFLLDADHPVAGVWNELRITMSTPRGYPAVMAEVLRQGDGDGITFVGGTLTIQPSTLLPVEIAAVDALELNRRYRVIIRIKSSANPNGLHFGEADSDDRLYFTLRQPPT